MMSFSYIYYEKKTEKVQAREKIKAKILGLQGDCECIYFSQPI